MAYGMLTSFALGAAQGLGGAIVNKLSKDQDAEIKAKADAEREARIEEAAIRSENRAVTREQSIYERNQADKTLETGANRQFEIDKINLQEKLKKADEQDKRDYENDPTTLAGQAKIAQINASKATNEAQQLELQTKQKILEAGSEWENAKTDEERRAIEDRIKGLTGKVGDSVEFKTSTDIIGYDKNDKPITKTTMNWVDTRNRTVTPVEGTSTTPLTDKQLKATANAKANAAGGTDYKGYQEIKPSTWYGGDSEEEIKKKEEFNKVYTETLANGGKAPTGMLGAKTSTPTSPAPFKADDPARQKEYDIIFGGVVKQHESGNKGVNAQNPTSTAGGTWQLIDETAVGYGAKKDANGKVSISEKDSVTPKFYADVYKSTNGDPAAMIAAGFGQNDVKQAVKDATKNGTSWWQEIDSDGVKKNMDEVYIRARESVARLQSVGIEPDARLLDFVDNYKATKIASATPDKSAFKLKAVRPAL